MDTHFTRKTLMMLAAAAVTIAVFAGCATAGTASGAQDTSGMSGKDIQTNIFQDVSGNNAKTLIASTADLTILDVRTPEEYAEGHVENAVNVDVQSASFRNELGNLDKNKPYLVYCRSGKRSAEAVNAMKELGFTNVNNLTGGITQWQADGGAITNQ